uniref:Uncharacterized protein n=1 Tax=Arundo donax TaxID=35708 RepID=A0A0A9HSG3_ARUDO
MQRRSLSDYHLKLIIQMYFRHRHHLVRLHCMAITLMHSASRLQRIWS